MEIKLFSHRILSFRMVVAPFFLGKDTDGEMIENSRIQPSTVGIPIGICGINRQPWDLS